MSAVIGSRAGGYRVTEAIWDNPGRGRYRGMAEVEPIGRVLIAVTAAQRVPVADTRTRLALELDGVVALRAIDELDVPLGPLHALVEDEPAGVPLAEWRGRGLSRPALIAIAVRVSELAARAHARGLALGGLRPELIYAAVAPGGRDPAFTAIAPRAVGFFATGGRVDSPGGPAFDMIFEPAAMTAAGRPPSPTSDVFTLAAGLGFVATGRHPFGGDSWAQQLDAMTRRDGSWSEPEDALLGVLESCLGRDEATRPTARQLCDRLAALP